MSQKSRIHVWDLGDNAKVADRFTILFPSGDAVTCGSSGNVPQGVFMTHDCYEVEKWARPFAGKKIVFEKLPQRVLADVAKLIAQFPDLLDRP